MKDLQTKKRFIELRSQGLSFDVISEKIDVSKSVLISWNREYFKIINNLKYIKTQSIIEQAKLKELNRIEFLSGQLVKINDEMNKRSFEDVPVRDLHYIRKDLLAELSEILSRQVYFTNEIDEQLTELLGITRLKEINDLKD